MTFLQDGNWHMVTVTTLLDQPGYAMYVDGNLTAEMNPQTGKTESFSMHFRCLSLLHPAVISKNLLNICFETNLSKLSK